MRIENEIANQLLKPFEKGKKIWGIHQGSKGMTSRIFCYDDLKRQRILSLGKTTDRNDVHRINMSKTELLKKFKETDYCYVIHADQILLNQYGDLFQNRNDIKDNTIFKLDGNKIVRVAIDKFVFDFKIVSFLEQEKAQSRNAKVFFSYRKHGVCMNILPSGCVSLKTISFNFSQWLKKLTLQCSFADGDAELKIYNGNIFLATFDSKSLHGERISLDFDRKTKINDLHFVFTNKGNKNCNMLIKRMEFEFFADQKVTFTPRQLKKQEILTSKDFSNAVRGTQKDSMIFSGIYTSVFCDKYFYIPDSNPIQYSMTVKNIGKETARIYTGFAAYNNLGKILWSAHYPYQKQTSPFCVLSAEKGSLKIKVKGSVAAAKNCMIAMDADIPCMNKLPNKIVSVCPMPDGNSEILLNTPLFQRIAPNSLIRICGSGGSYLYKDCGLLKPGETRIFSGKIHRDDNSFEYTPDQLPRGVEYIKPIVLSHSTNGRQKNTVEITDFRVTR